MIDFESYVGDNVFVQFKHAAYGLAHMQGKFQPLAAMDPNGQPTGGPMVVDHMEGKLMKNGNQYSLLSGNVADGGKTQISCLFDPADVAFAFVAQRVSLATASSIIAP